MEVVDEQALLHEVVSQQTEPPTSLGGPYLEEKEGKNHKIRVLKRRKKLLNRRGLRKEKKLLKMTTIPPENG